ncbi:hypothetical protein HZC08_01120, partial [Candidatus Micrarchaeota archaeon]|nr:hypothetical protein [Candidatus Micrarchaeota archaeon]
MPSLLRRRTVQTPVSVTSASGRFGKYKPEPHIEVREAVVTSDKLGKLRTLREALKTVDPETAFSQLKFHPNLNLIQALLLAQENGWLIASSSVHDRILNRTDANYKVQTGTLVVYEAPGKPFGKKVTVSRTHNSISYSITFEVPEHLRGKKDRAIALEHPDFILVKTGEQSYEIKLAEGAEVHLVENFPSKNGWYVQDKLGIPHGQEVKESEEVRSLWRVNTSYVGLLVR